MLSGLVGEAAPRGAEGAHAAHEAQSVSQTVSGDELLPLTLDPLGAGQPEADSVVGPSSGVLAQALSAGEFVAHLQPQVDLATGRVIGVEALARWQRPGQGLMAPVSFLAAVEASGLMSLLTGVVLDDALRWLADRRCGGAEPIAIAVNVSASSVELGLVSRIRDALEKWRVPPHLVTIEITETALMHDAVGAAEVLGCLKSLGLQVSIDDFGTGYSSLARLHHLPIDEIKIDRGFIRDLREGRDRGMVKTIAALGRNFGLRVVAEGVEHEPELAQLAAMGCDVAQGFIISPPLPTGAFNDWLSTYLDVANFPIPAPPRPHVSTASNPDRRPISGGLGARLRSVAQRVTKQETLEIALEQLLGDLAGEIGARFAACWLDNSEAQQLEPLALWSAAGTAECPLAQASRDVRFAPGRGLPGTVLAADAPVRITDLSADRSFLRSRAADRAGCSSAVAFPLRSNNQPIGVLEFLGTNVVPVTIVLDEALGNIGTLVGEFICARQAEQRVNDLSGVLAGTTSAIGRLNSAHPDAVPGDLCAAVREIAAAHAVLLWQPNPHGQVLTVMAASGAPAEGVRASLTGEHSGAASAYHARKPIFIADVAAHVLPSKKLAAIAQAASALYQPVCYRDETLGVLAVAWKQRRSQLPSEIQLAIELLAQSAAPLLHHRRVQRPIGQ